MCGTVPTCGAGVFSHARMGNYHQKFKLIPLLLEMIDMTFSIGTDPFEFAQVKITSQSTNYVSICEGRPHFCPFLIVLYCMWPKLFILSGKVP